MLKGNHPGLQRTLSTAGPVIIACSGGIDSLLLAVVAHRILGSRCHIAHSIGPSVPPEATERVKAFAQKEGWLLHLLKAEEFFDEDYLSNPVNRCFFCKSHLYQAMSRLSRTLSTKQEAPFTLMSGTNCDDLSEYRPGLIAAEDFEVRHPYVEAGMGKDDIRRCARHLGLPFSELPASPCLSSRLYTGTRVTPERLEAVHFSETTLQKHLSLKMVRCRLDEDHMKIEVLSSDRGKFNAGLLDALKSKIKKAHPFVRTVALDPSAYRPGRAFKKAVQ